MPFDSTLIGGGQEQMIQLKQQLDPNAPTFVSQAVSDCLHHHDVIMTSSILGYIHLHAYDRVYDHYHCTHASRPECCSVFQSCDCQ